MSSQPDSVTEGQNHETNRSKTARVWAILGISLGIVAAICGIIEGLTGTISNMLQLYPAQQEPTPTNTLAPTSTNTSTPMPTETNISPTETPLLAEVLIENPGNGAVVDVEIEVSGIYRNVAENDAIWVIVQPAENGRYYPHRTAATKHDDGMWSSGVEVGGGISGEAFTIHVAVVNDTGQVCLDAYVEQSLENNTWSGFDDRPCQVDIKDSVGVTSE